eukprot:COSAG01_NODE_6317_length_3739_cov_2.900549_3_plen_323_part_00
MSSVTTRLPVRLRAGNVPEKGCVARVRAWVVLCGGCRGESRSQLPVLNTALSGLPLALLQALHWRYRGRGHGLESMWMSTTHSDTSHHYHFQGWRPPRALFCARAAGDAEAALELRRVRVGMVRVVVAAAAAAVGATVLVCFFFFRRRRGGGLVDCGDAALLVDCGDATLLLRECTRLVAVVPGSSTGDTPGDWRSCGCTGVTVVCPRRPPLRPPPPPRPPPCPRPRPRPAGVRGGGMRALSSSGAARADGAGCGPEGAGAGPGARAAPPVLAVSPLPSLLEPSCVTALRDTTTFALHGCCNARHHHTHHQEHPAHTQCRIV